MTSASGHFPAPWGSIWSRLRPRAGLAFLLAAEFWIHFCLVSPSQLFLVWNGPYLERFVTKILHYPAWRISAGSSLILPAGPQPVPVRKAPVTGRTANPPKRIRTPVPLVPRQAPAPPGCCRTREFRAVALASHPRAMRAAGVPIAVILSTRVRAAGAQSPPG